MRALQFCGLTLAVAAAHLAAWLALAASLPGGSRHHGGRAPASLRRVAWLRAVDAGARGVADPALAAESGQHARADEPTLRATQPAPQRPEPPRRAPRLADPTVAPARPSAGARPPAGRQGPPARSAPAPAATGAPAPWPVYAARPPPSLRLHYALRQTNPGGAAPAGQAELVWTRTAGGYALRLAAQLDGHGPREWFGTGRLVATGLAPKRLVQLDRGRVTRGIHFDPACACARWDGAAPESALAPGAQDRWSWLAQLAAMAEAYPRQLAVSHLQVAGLRGQLDRWTFRAVPGAPLPPDALSGVPARMQAAPLLHLVREPDRPYDLRVEAWLAPAIHHFPIALRLTTPPGQWSFTLRLASIDAGGGAAP
jgi:hypothetical protein